MGRSDHVDHDPTLFNLLVCCFCLGCTMCLTYFGLGGLLEIPQSVRQKHRSSTTQTQTSATSPRRISVPVAATSQREDRQKRRYKGRSYLQWIALFLLATNGLYQLTLVEYYVLQRILMRGFNRKSPLFFLCRVNQYLIWQTSSLSLNCSMWFWLELLISTFAQGMAVMRPSNMTIYSYYVFFTVSVAMAATVGILNALNANEIVEMNSSDVNVYAAMNDNMSKCYIRDAETTVPGILAVCNALIGVALTSSLLATFAWRMFEVTRNDAVKEAMAKKQLAVVFKSVTTLAVTCVSGVCLSLVVLFTGRWVLFGVISLISTSAVIFFFQFGQQYFNLFCGCFHKLTLRTLNKQRTNVLTSASEF